MIGTVLRASRLFNQGQTLAAQQRFAEAVAVLTQAASLRPRSAGIRLHLALAVAETAQFDAASDTLQQAIALQPRNPVLPMFLGQIAMDAGQYPQARIWCDRALQLNPHNCHTLGLLALLDLLQDTPQHGAQRLLQPVPMPVPPLERAAMWLARSRLPSLLQQANSALQSRVLLHIETVLLGYGTNARTLTQQVLAAEQRENRLLLWLDHGLTRGVMALRRGIAHSTAHRQPEQQANRLLALQAEEAVYLGEHTTAIRLYQRLLQQDDAPQARQHLWQLLYEQGEYAAALVHLQDVLPTDAATPPDAMTSLVLGELLYYAGHYAAAKVALQRATEGPLQDYKALYYMGLCALQDGQQAAARRYFAQAVRLLNPDIATLRLQEWGRLTQANVG